MTAEKPDTKWLKCWWKIDLTMTTVMWCVHLEEIRTWILTVSSVVRLHSKLHIIGGWKKKKKEEEYRNLYNGCFRESNNTFSLFSCFILQQSFCHWKYWMLSEDVDTEEGAPFPLILVRSYLIIQTACLMHLFWFILSFHVLLFVGLLLFVCFKLNVWIG